MATMQNIFAYKLSNIQETFTDRLCRITYTVLII
jgi:hypothetical protein